jgi:hypothetical protein
VACERTPGPGDRTRHLGYDLLDRQISSRSLALNAEVVTLQKKIGDVSPAFSHVFIQCIDENYCLPDSKLSED